MHIAFDEDTNGHVDNVATFARPTEIVLSWTDDVEDVNYKLFKEAEDVLQNNILKKVLPLCLTNILGIATMLRQLQPHLHLH